MKFGSLTPMPLNRRVPLSFRHPTAIQILKHGLTLLSEYKEINLRQIWSLFSYTESFDVENYNATGKTFSTDCNPSFLQSWWVNLIWAFTNDAKAPMRHVWISSTAEKFWHK